MASIQIPNLGAAIALDGSEQLEAVQAGTSVRVTTSQIAGLAFGSLAAINPGKVIGRDTVSGIGPAQELPIAVDATGNVGIGTSTPGSYGKLAVAGAGTVLAQIISDNTGEGQLVFSSVAAGRISVQGAFPFIIQTNSVERMRVSGSGNVGIATASPDASAILDVTSTTGGLLFPRLTTTQRNAISSPANGLVLYNTTTDKLQVRAAGAWVDLH